MPLIGQGNFTRFRSCQSGRILPAWVREGEQMPQAWELTFALVHPVPGTPAVGENVCDQGQGLQITTFYNKAITNHQVCYREGYRVSF